MALLSPGIRLWMQGTMPAQRAPPEAALFRGGTGARKRSGGFCLDQIGGRDEALIELFDGSSWLEAQFLL